MALPMVTRWGVHDVAAFPTDTHLDAPGLNHGRFRTCLTMTLPDPTRPVPIEDSTRCDRCPAKSHAPMLRAVVTFGADRGREKFWASSRMRTPTQTRAVIEFSRARGPYTARRKFSPATVLRAGALLLKRQHSLVAYGVGQLTLQRLYRRESATCFRPVQFWRSRLSRWNSSSHPIQIPALPMMSVGAPHTGAVHRSGAFLLNRSSAPSGRKTYSCDSLNGVLFCWNPADHWIKRLPWPDRVMSERTQ